MNLLDSNRVSLMYGLNDHIPSLTFSVTTKSNKLWTTPYSDYQLYLYERITKLRKEGLGYRKISNLFNKEGLLTCRGKKFSNSSIHSILKKKNIRDERLNREFKTEVSEFKLDCV